jgi:transcriptional antiterminator NusG
MGGEKQWFVIHTYSGFEKKVKDSLEQRVDAHGMKDRFGKILIPEEEVYEIKAGKRETSKKKVFPGYILINMELTDETWHLVRNTPRVTGFVGTGKKPAPVSEDEVEKILHQVQSASDKPKPKFTFEKGESVRIIDGPFCSFTGVVDDVNAVRNTLKVMVTIFGRATPVELDFGQVEKV